VHAGVSLCVPLLFLLSIPLILVFGFFITFFLFFFGSVQQIRVGGVAQWQNVGLWPANFPCPALDLQLMGDH